MTWIGLAQADVAVPATPIAAVIAVLMLLVVALIWIVKFLLADMIPKLQVTFTEANVRIVTAFEKDMKEQRATTAHEMKEQRADCAEQHKELIEAFVRRNEVKKP